MINVFIDTQVFVHNNFNFNNGLFRRLISAVDNKLVTVYLTDVVEKEVELKILENVEEVKNSQRTFIKNAKILRNLNKYDNVFDIEKNLDSISDCLINQFKQFLKEVDVKIISVEDVSPTLIFEKYFKVNPPFSGKKKDEFPDAFSLIALQNIFEEKGQKVHIVSNDRDLKYFCENKELFLYEPSLESFFSSLNDHYHQKYFDYVVFVYDNNIDEMSEQIEEQINKSEFTLSNEDGDINKIYIDSIELDEDPYIIEIEIEEGITIMATNVTISLTANVSYIDYASSPYDKEERKYLFYQYEETEIVDVVIVPVQMTVGFKHDDEYEIKIIDIVINEHEYIGIQFHDSY